MDLRQTLFDNQDLGYRDFHANLVPNISKENFIGVRVPIIRRIAKQAFKENADNPCQYHEERMVKAFTIGMAKCDVAQHKQDITDFVPYINNWAVCDSASASFKFISKALDEYYDFIVSFAGKGTYATRFCIVALMDYYLVDEYIDRVIDLYTHIKSDEYYINMALAWALSFVYIKYPQRCEAVLKSKVLSPWVQNKTIQKIRESNRVDKATKDYLLTYKIK